MNIRMVIALSVPLTAGLAGCSDQTQVETFSVDMTEVREHLETVASARVLFGHQSVGRNILAGLSELAAETGVELRIEETNGAPSASGPGVFHSNIGKNGDYESKCVAFEHLLMHPDRPAYDIAMMKFCYADMGRGIDAEAAAMMTRYTALIDDLQTHRPDVEIVHATMPVRSKPGGWRNAVKRIIGREISQDSDNALRNAFNDLLRERYAGEPLFDIAVLESTLPNGRRASFKHNGRTVYTLAPEYTYDGGHLVPAAQRMAAAEFLKVVASVLDDKR